MCSIWVNSIADEQLDDLECSGHKHLKKRIFQFADEANEENPGALDNPGCHFKGMPAELRDVRKKEIGRHRIYFTGFHKQCCYHLLYVKKFKKDGVDDEFDKSFQKKLLRALREEDSEQITIETELKK